MKKLFVLAFLALFGAQAGQAQEMEYGLFNHLSAGVSLGTTGIGIEVAAPVTSFMDVRAGYSFMPKIKVTPTIDFDSNEDFLRKENGTGYYDEADVEGKLNMGDFKLLLDFYPIKNNGFHLTAGAYVGNKTLAKANTTNHFINQDYWGTSGPELGNASNTYTVVSDAQGVIHAEARVKSFKPYVGFGFGRAVPKSRVNVTCDFGVQFWGKPALWTNIDDNLGTEFRKVEKDRILSQQSYCDDIKDALDIVEKVIVYPVLTVLINGLIF